MQGWFVSGDVLGLHSDDDIYRAHAYTHHKARPEPDRRVQLISGLYPLLLPIRGIISQDRCPANVDRQFLLAGALQNAAAALCEMMIFLPPFWAI